MSRKTRRDRDLYFDVDTALIVVLTVGVALCGLFVVGSLVYAAYMKIYG